jgi:LDH2 family malate/lactate/ureidoglycolate dehydrogenase
MEPLPEADDGWSFLIIALAPSLFGRLTFEERATALADAVRTTPTAEGFHEVRMPFDRSRAERTARLRDGVVLSAVTYERLTLLAREGRPG